MAGKVQPIRGAGVELHRMTAGPERAWPVDWRWLGKAEVGPKIGRLEKVKK